MAANCPQAAGDGTYGYMALRQSQVRLRHCLDLQAQLKELAEDPLAVQVATCHFVRGLCTDCGPLQGCNRVAFCVSKITTWQQLPVQDFAQTLGGTPEERCDMLIASLKEAKAGVDRFVFTLKGATVVNPCLISQVDLDEAEGASQDLHAQREVWLEAGGSAVAGLRER